MKPHTSKFHHPSPITSCLNIHSHSCRKFGAISVQACSSFWTVIHEIYFVSPLHVPHRVTAPNHPTFIHSVSRSIFIAREKRPCIHMLCLPGHVWAFTIEVACLSERLVDGRINVSYKVK